LPPDEILPPPAPKNKSELTSLIVVAVFVQAVRFFYVII